MSRPISTRDLLASERTFVAAMTNLGFGRLEYLRIERGELVLNPWPAGRGSLMPAQRQYANNVRSWTPGAR